MADLRELLDEYDLTRSRNTQRYDRRLEEFYAANPDIGDLLEKRTAALLASMKQVIADKPRRDDTVRHAKSQADAIDAEIQRILEERNIQIPEPVFSCPDCADTGFVNTPTGRQFCKCLEKRVFSDIFHSRPIEGIQKTFRDFDESIYGEDNDQQRKLSLKVKAYLEDYGEKYPENDRRTLVLTGQPGLGKTFMLESLIAKISPKTDNLLYISAFDLFSTFHKYRLGEIDTIDPIFNVEALFIDDVGSEQLTQNVTREYMFQLVNQRQAQGKHLFLATNLEEKGLKERYTERVASRLFAKDTSLVFRFKGRDLRI